MPASEAADSLGLSRRTLEGWRVSGGGPEFVRFGRRILYPLWLGGQIVSAATTPANQMKNATANWSHPETPSPRYFFNAQLVSGQAARPENNANHPLVGGQGPRVNRSQSPRPPAMSVHTQPANRPSEEMSNLTRPGRVFDVVRIAYTRVIMRSILRSRLRHATHQCANVETEKWENRKLVQEHPLKGDDDRTRHVTGPIPSVPNFSAS